MNKFFTKLKAQAEENPTVAIGLGTAVVATATKLVDTISAAQGRKAYAKQVKYRVKNKK